jgi:hypothetical protein
MTDNDKQAKQLNDLKYPAICRSPEQIMVAHDLLGYMLENPHLYIKEIHPETWCMMEGALDALCWMLDHNNSFIEAMGELLEIKNKAEAGRAAARAAAKKEPEVRGRLPGLREGAPA